MAVTKNARLFLERAGLRPTYRRPSPTVVPSELDASSFYLDAPLPLPELIRDGYPAPDRGLTRNDPWHLG